MDIHTTSTPDKVPFRESEWFKNASAFMPLVRWVAIGIAFAFGVYAYQRDTNAASNVNVLELQRNQQSIKDEMTRRAGERDKQLDALDKKMLTREVFEAYHEADNQRMERMEQMMEKILEK